MKPEILPVASAEAKPSATRKINYMIKTINIKKSKRWLVSDTLNR